MPLPPEPSNVPPPAARSGSLSRLSFVLSGVMIAVYCGFVLMVAYEKPLLGSQVVPGLSWGILLGASVIVSAWLLTLVYIIAANRKGGA